MTNQGYLHLVATSLYSQMKSRSRGCPIEILVNRAAFEQLRFEAEEGSTTLCAEFHNSRTVMGAKVRCVETGHTDAFFCVAEIKMSMVGFG